MPPDSQQAKQMPSSENPFLRLVDIIKYQDVVIMASELQIDRCESNIRYIDMIKMAVQLSVLDASNRPAIDAKMSATRNLLKTVREFSALASSNKDYALGLNIALRNERKKKDGERSQDQIIAFGNAIIALQDRIRNEWAKISAEVIEYYKEFEPESMTNTMLIFGEVHTPEGIRGLKYVKEFFEKLRPHSVAPPPLADDD